MGIEAIYGIVALLGLLALGIPIYIVLMGLGIVLLLLDGGSVAGIAQTVLDHMNSATLMAVPFFVIAAGFIQGGGIARALILMAASWIGRLPGGIPLAALAATAMFSAISGSSVATVLAMGTMVVPEMLERGYKRPFALGVTAAAGTLGILIPPSMPMVIYGLMSETSIPRLFLAGVVPGAIQVGLFSLVIMVMARGQGGKPIPFPGWPELARANLAALPALAVPLIVLGGIYGGFVTVTEAAALSAAVALLVSVFVYRSLKLSAVPEVLVQGISRTAAILLIIAGANLLSLWLTRDGLAVRLAELVMGLELSATQFLFVMAGILLVLGTVLEGYSIILITLPLTVPILHALGIDTVQYAIVMIVGIEIAMLTPPVGLNLFVMAEVAKAPVTEVQRGMLPFLAAMIILWITVILVPQLSTGLPDMLLGAAR
ncbi:MAG: TRAP transporter large permease [Phaeovulum sp.]|uniref:TRAP transporter large permease n=1 Tax=Phaeovulum sp. TaxID=2934796 RepID=UPI002730784C|nr:TRAP transporter large permease [Phaeovulum sp.]MDP2063055.1 TRAP transporter large permease [Phaeovulum sp.]MDP3862697.1 TRAP transporter large permease [Phaeovulum sp.]